MASPIKETIKTTHKIQIIGTLDVDNMKIQPEDEEEKDIKKLIHGFDANYVKIIITNETESEIPENTEE
jgi:hypothetical protein